MYGGGWQIIMRRRQGGGQSEGRGRRKEAERNVQCAEKQSELIKKMHENIHIHM